MMHGQKNIKLCLSGYEICKV